jgi:Lon-like protease BrxL-like, ATPase domain
MAFHDRWHAHLPGWEMPKMQLAYFTSHMGFIADSEQARAELRWSSSIPLTDGCGCRDQGVGAETGLVGDAVLKRLRQRTFIDETATRRIDENCVAPHHPDFAYRPSAVHVV